MRLLFDQNLSHRLIEILTDIWPGSSHVSTHGLERASDQELWNFAQQQRYCLVSKDSDFLHLAVLRGAPPKAIIVRLGNASTDEILDCLFSCKTIIDDFHDHPTESVLIIP